MKNLARLPGWPRMMSRDLAATYCGVSVNNLERVFGVEPVRVNAKRVLFDRRDLDAAIERLKGKGFDGDPIMGAINASNIEVR